MTEYEAEVEAGQPWVEDGTADVTPKPPYPNTSTFSLPLEHRESSPVTVLRSEYPNGLVIIPTDTPPEGNPATLPMEVSSGDSIVVNSGGDHQSWPDGIVARFTGF
ncbi:MAG: hypothetical protein KAW09_09545 [Thermoplasmata archaeon]|nr:hypothetical protein [Thermoplasmata archaeon]